MKPQLEAAQVAAGEMLVKMEADRVSLSKSNKTIELKNIYLKQNSFYTY